MNHVEVRELLELAAVEPGGLDRLEAGDTPEAASAAGHLAGCASCLDELNRLRRSTGVIRSVVMDETLEIEPPVALPPELRERTLAFVRELGVPRPRVAPAVSVLAAPVTTAGPMRTAGPATSIDERTAAGVTDRPGVRRIRRASLVRPAAWIASIAAAVVLSVVATNALQNAGPDKTGLAEVVRWAVDMRTAPDARSIVLTAADTGQARGELTIVPTTGALVVVVPELAVAPSGHEYRCWLQTATGRTWVGKMSVDEGVSYWVGMVPTLAAAPSGTTFGVSLEDAAGKAIDGTAVIRGSL